MVRTWLFGEAEYESSEDFMQNYDRLFHCAEACGYMIEREKGSKFRVIVLDGSDMEHVRITFENDKKIATKITKWQFTDRNPEHIELINKEILVVNH